MDEIIDRKTHFIHDIYTSKNLKIEGTLIHKFQDGPLLYIFGTPQKLVRNSSITKTGKSITFHT